jgi:small GTP-binding protein
MNEPTSIKVVLLGESGVGKTSIINQFISKKFNPKMNTSVSAQFTSKIMEFPEQKRTLRFDIWDTVGQEKYRSLTKIFYKDAKIIIFVYDITTEYSFNALQNYWYTETVDNTDGDPIYAVCANKYDLYDKAVVQTQDGKKFADKIKAIFQNTSAKSDTGINILFENLGKKIIDPNYDYKNFKKKENIILKENNNNNNNNDGKNGKNNNSNGNNKKGCC